MNESWKNDPRLKGMDQEKLSLLLDLAGELEKAPESLKLTALLSVSKRAADRNIRFSPEERELLISILTEGMSPEEKSRVRLLLRLAGRMPSGGRGQ